MLEKGDILQNRYRIIRELGRGGMGAVYEAEDNQRFGKPVALKEILVNLTNKNSEHFRRAFEREAKILTQIDHEAVPKVVGYILHTDCQILVMELIEGNDLDEILEKRQTPFPLANVLSWTDQLLDALDYLHTLRQPIVHRDIKPQNLKLTSRGKIKLLDFGIAKDTEIEITMTNMPQKTFVGATLYYSPIEQIIRIPDYFEMIKSIYPEKANKIVNQSADARSDIYALGATLYHLLTNTFPRPAHLRALEVWAGDTDSLKPANFIIPEIPPEISDCLRKSMEIERENRYASAFDMQTALQEAILIEKRRRDEEERNIWFAEQTKLRLELEAAQRKLDEELQRQQLRESEAARRKQEQRESEERFKQWQREKLLEKNVSAAEPLPDTMAFFTEPLNESFSSEKTLALPELPVERLARETDTPVSGNDVRFASENPKTDSATMGNVKSLTAPVVSASALLPKQTLWILPVVVVGFLVFGGSVFGLFMLFNNSNSGTANEAIKNPETALPTVVPVASPTISPTASPVQIVTEKDNTKPTTSTPVVGKTPAQTEVKTQVKTPAVPKTQKPQKLQI